MRSWATSTRATSVNWPPPAPCCSSWANSGYYIEVPDLRPYLLSNTAAVFALTALVLMLPLGLEAMLVGITATMICYVLLNLRYRPLVRAGQVPT